MAHPRRIGGDDKAIEGEGFVLRWPDGTRAKVKLDDYVRLHRLMFGTSTKTVWAALRAGETPEALTGDIPVELRAWIGEQADLLRGLHAGILADVEGFVAEARGLGLVSGPRKEFAQWVNTHAELGKRRLKGLVFGVADGRGVGDEIWRMIEPVFAQPPWISREDGE